MKTKCNVPWQAPFFGPLLNALLLLITIAFGFAYIVPWFDKQPIEWQPIEWQRFSMESLEYARSEEKPSLVLFKPRLGFTNDLAVTTLNHPTIQRAFLSGQFLAMDYEFGYAEPIPDGEHDEISWLVSQPAYHKDAFAVIALPDGTTLPVSVLDPEDAITKLSIRSNGLLYLGLSIASLCFLVGRIILGRKSRDKIVKRANPDCA